MKLSYVNILGDGKRHTIKATITTEHPLSSYGQPVLLLEDGQPLNSESWILMAYQVVKATPQEFEMLKQWVDLINFFVTNSSSAAAALGSKGGSATSEAKKRAARDNGRKGGRPRKEK